MAPISKTEARERWEEKALFKLNILPTKQDDIYIFDNNIGRHFI